MGIIYRREISIKIVEENIIRGGYIYHASFWKNQILRRVVTRRRSKSP